MSKREDKDFSRLACTFCCKVVPGVGVIVRAGVCSDNASNERGSGQGGDVKRRFVLTVLASLHKIPKNCHPIVQNLCLLLYFYQIF